MLRSLAFRHSERIIRAEVNAPPLSRGERGIGVALLQGALIKAGFSLPISTSHKGKPDGIFGNETEQAVRSFQRRQPLFIDGRAGRDTIAALDAILFASEHPAPHVTPRPSPPPPSPPIPAKVAAPPSPPPTPFVPPSDPDFEVGTGDPPLNHDPGAGPWNSKSTEISMYLMHDAMMDPRFLGVASVTVGSHAAENLRHYLGNSGLPHQIDLAAMINDVPSAETLYSTLALKVGLYAGHFPEGSWDITSKHTWGTYDKKSESRDWYYAVGGFTAWIKGRIKVTGGSGPKTVDFEGQYKFYDRYNWDEGKSVTIAGIRITDKFMGEFHREGLSREYDNFGSCRAHFRWDQAVSLAPQLDPVSSR